MLALVIDDEPALRTVCQKLLLAMGHECEAASTVDEAVLLAADHKFDIILCDYRLDHETAADVIRALQETAPTLVRRIVLATGDSTRTEVTDLADAHGLRVIGKPFGRAELNALLTSQGLSPESGAGF